LRRKEKECLQEKETRKSYTVRKFNQRHVNSLHSNSTCLDDVSLTDCNKNIQKKQSQSSVIPRCRQNDW